MNLFQRVGKTIGKFFLGNSTPGLWSWAMPGQWNKKMMLEQYTRYVYAVVSAIAQEAAKVNLEMYKNDKVVDNHPFLSLIKRPNPDVSQFQFLEMHFTYMLLAGESYWYLARGLNSLKTKELHLLRPDLMQVVVDKTDPRGMVAGYLMVKPDGTKEPFNKDEVLHFKMPNPLDRYYGLGTIQAAKTYIQTEEYASTWTKNSIFNSGRPSGILNVKGVIDKDEFEQLKKQFKENYSGTENAGKTMMLKGADGLDYQKLGMELQEVALKELKDMTRDDIMVMFRVSKTILGITDDVNRANALEAREVFTRNVIVPTVDRMMDHLNAFLIPDWGDGFLLSYEDPTLQSDADRLAEWTAGHNKWLTTNDIRGERQLDPIPGGDVIREPFSLTPTSGDPKGDLASAPVITPTKGLKKKDLEVNKKLREKIFTESLFSIQDHWMGLYQGIMDTEFKLQQKEILANNKKSSFIEWLFDVDASQTRIVGKLFPLGIELMKAAAKVALELAGDKETELEVVNRITDYIHDRTTRLATATNDETIKSIEAAISEGTQNGESVAKLRERVKEVYSYATDTRAQRIARTESIAVSNEGSLAAYRQSPLVTGKEWATTGDPCEFCAELEGKVVEIDSNFANLGHDFTGADGGKLKIDYEDIEHPPIHPNCRCVLLPVVLEN
jgi:HK97 family phage portal protein